MIGSSFEWTGNRNTPNLLLPHDDPQPINSVEDGVFVISAVRIQTGYYGYIRYVVRMELDRPWRFNKRNHKAFTVVPAFDLNTIPQAVLPVKEVKVKNLGIILFRHGKVTLECEISKSGFVPGEMIVVRARLINDSSKDIVKARVKLVEISSYVAYRVFRTLPPSSFINSAGLYNRQRQQRTLATGEQVDSTHVALGLGVGGSTQTTHGKKVFYRQPTRLLWGRPQRTRTVDSQASGRSVSGLLP
ncbi:hypothetical protein Y032_0203g1852 [Ancylostoma ceylanicum]|uniref:Arrestin C-terminal-like domain-containing protein n=1 Tax=Ancylostoma ceylanicum TaxID=53326 RepID=A0A016SN08_9BILA|nr:hypothetical protein Y032_0203g1852 [Ancylostoma ceylanicum]